MKSNADLIFDFVQDHLLAVLSVPVSFVILVIFIAFSMQFYFSKKRIGKRLCSRLGLVPEGNTLVKNGYQLNVEASPFGNATIIHVFYSVNLPKIAQGLSLSREGADSAIRAHHGSREESTGDQDFDDTFWVKANPKNFLTPQRRTLLLEVFSLLGPDAQIEAGRVVGKVRCEQSPFGINNVVRELEIVERLRTEISEPSTQASKARPGGVRRRQCRQTAALFALPGISLLALFGALFPVDTSNFFYLGLQLLGFLYLSTAVAFWNKRKLALPLARASQIATSLAMVASIPFWHESSSLLDKLLGVGLVIAAIHQLNQAYFSLTRIKLD